MKTAVALLLAGLVAMASAAAPAPAPAAVTLPANVVDLLQSSPDFTLLSTALASMPSMLAALKTFNGTVFAPTNAAFTKTLADLKLSPTDILAQPKLAAQILGNHLVLENLSLADLEEMNGEEIETESGPVMVSVASNGTITLKSGTSASIVKGDIDTQNGAVVHVIDYVLSPPSVIAALKAANSPAAAPSAPAIVAKTSGAEKAAVPAVLALLAGAAALLV